MEVGYVLLDTPKGRFLVAGLLVAEFGKRIGIDFEEVREPIPGLFLTH